MSWCDKLFSVPSAGFELDRHFASGDTLLEAVTPILNKIVNKSSKLSVEKHDSFAFEVSLEDGFKYGLDFNRVYVNFQHKMRFRTVSGGLPVGELISNAQPYTILLQDVISRLLEVTANVPQSRDRHFSRFGIVSNTDVDEDDMPPGLRRLIKYFTRPWNNVTGGLNINITGVIAENEKFTDRCIHQIRKSEEDGVPLSIKLDWQRVFSKSRPIDVDILQLEAEQGKKAALRYFEDVGEGNRFDEEIIQSTTVF